MSETYSQSSAVAEFYDNTEAMEVFAGENLHVGYWDTLPGDPTDQGADFVEAQNRLTDLVGARSGAVQNARLLDVGCGTGGPARRLARTTGVAVTGVTLSSNQVEVAAARSREQGLDTRTDFRLADAASLPFADQQFDGAFAIESILHMQDKPAVFGEIFRVLRPGAAFCIADVVLTETDAIADVATAESIDLAGPMLSLMAALTLEDYRRLAGQAGFGIENVVDISKQTQPSYRRLLRRLDHGRAELVSLAGVEQVTALEQALSLVDAAGSAGKFGYLLLTARKPTTSA